VQYYRFALSLMTVTPAEAAAVVVWAAASPSLVGVGGVYVVGGSVTAAAPLAVNTVAQRRTRKLTRAILCKWDAVLEEGSEMSK
jgi:hypothetical protein